MLVCDVGSNKRSNHQRGARGVRDAESELDRGRSAAAGMLNVDYALAVVFDVKLVLVVLADDAPILSPYFSRMASRRRSV